MNEGQTEILLVEDDMVTSQLLEFTLQELGYRTMVRANGREGWKAWNKRRTPIVVSDWEMPEMTGIDLVKKIRRQPGPLYTYFICLTARNSPTDYSEAMEAGVDDFLSKPLKKGPTGHAPPGG